MTPLANQQRALQTAILSDVAPADLLAGPDAARRFSIYADAYRARLAAALRDNYPVLHRVLGDEDFDALARAYLHAHPSVAPSIRWFGGALADFVQATPDALPHPALVDLIRLEWALRAAFDAEDAPPMGFATLAALPPDRWPALRLRLHPSVSRLALAWAVEPLWQALAPLEDGQSPEQEPPPPEPHVHGLIAWRQGLTPCWRSVEALEGHLLAALAGGAAFADLCTLAADAGEEAAAHQVAGLLRRWVDEGLLQACDALMSTP